MVSMITILVEMFLNVLTSKKFLLEIEKINGTKSGRDYTIDHKGEFDLIIF